MIDKTAAERIQDLAEKATEPKVRTFHGIEYSLSKWEPVRPPMPDALTLNTLSGLVDFAKNERGSAKGTAFNFSAFIASHATVYLVSKLDDQFQTRKTYAVAAMSEGIYGKGFPFGEFLELEQFLIQAQSKILHDEALRSLLAVVGNIQSGHVRTLEDDGVTQVVEARAGITRRANVKIENPVTLRPYRTFREIEQPASPFILRLRGGGEDKLPTAALFEADGGSWKIAAIDGIAGYLRKNAEGLTVLA